MRLTGTATCRRVPKQMSGRRISLAVVLMSSVLGLAACSASRISNVQVYPGMAVDRKERVLLLRVPDGPANHRGSATLAALRDALASHGVPLAPSDTIDLSTGFDEAAALRCAYILRAEVILWEDRLTWMSNRPDKATISVELWDASSRALVASGTHAVTGAIEEYVDRHPDRFVPELADASLGRIFGWSQTIFAEE
jgi:hypothetical protein